MDFLSNFLLDSENVAGGSNRGGSLSILKDGVCNEGASSESALAKSSTLPPVKRKALQGNTAGARIASGKTPETYPSSASNILRTLNAAKMSESNSFPNEHWPRSQNTGRSNMYEQKPKTRFIRVQYRRRVAVSFSNYGSESPVILAKFHSNREFDSAH